MAVASAQFLEPYEGQEVKVEPSALVIGAGVSGMTCALSLANQGFKVYIVEKESKVGGLLNRIYKLYPTNREASDLVDSLLKELKKHKNVKLLLSSTVKDVKGHIGIFDVTVAKGDGENVKLKVGTIIVATGAVAFEPLGMYGYGEYEGVVTQLEFEELMRSKSLEKPSKVVMIQCVGDREEKGRTYCSRICCMVAIKNSMLIKEMNPEADVYILYRDLQTYGKQNEQYHLSARDHGIKFVEYSVDKPPEVSLNPEGKLRVKVYHNLLGEEISIDSDLVILSTPLIQHQAGKELSRILKVPLGPDEFFSEYKVKMNPVEFMIDGIYVCGTAQGPKDVNESIVQAYAAASRAAIPMSTGRIIREPLTAFVNEELCVGCGICVDICPFEAHIIEEGKSKVIEALCKGCGACAAGCPRRAISLKSFSDRQLLAEVQAAFAK
jgi:heterodisulfide reductase subunit A